MISSQLQTSRRAGLLKQITSLRFLLSQGLTIRDHTEDERSLSQLLKLRTEDSETMQAWRALINIISVQEVLGQILEKVKSPNSSRYGIIADEATDVSNKQQFNIV